MSTPKPLRQSLFFQDLATPISSTRSRGKFPTQIFSNTDLPPPPAFTLEDKSDFSPEFDHSASPVAKQSSTIFKNDQEFSTPTKPKPGAAGSESPETPAAGLSSNWWSASRSSGGGDKGKGSPVEGVVDDGLVTLPPPREVVRPEVGRRGGANVGSLDEEEWVTVYGFSPAETNMVLREFEKCGAILKHVPGPREANWMHILYQNRFDAQKALSKNGTQLNGFLIIGVKPVDPMQRQALNEKLKHQGFMPLPHSSSKTLESNSVSPHPYHVQNGSSSIRASGTVATPTKSYMSKIVDLMFGV